MNRLELEPTSTLVLCVDWQERLCAAMPSDLVAAATRNVTHLLTLAQRLDLPVVASEQYPQGLGATVAEVAALLPNPAHAKVAFSAWRAPEVRGAIEATARTQIVLVGMETHICVYQTARDLAGAGYAVHVPIDAVVSRTTANVGVGVELLRAAGVQTTCTEAVLFDLLKEGRGEAFKEVSRRIR
jgi:nicotinamidase-related amidase